MPELPDVEGFRRVVAENAKGRRIDAVEVIDRAMLRNRTSQALGRTLKGRRFREPKRHGKWLIAPVGDASLLVHFGMTGLFEWCDPGVDRHRHDRIVFQCASGELRYRDMRRFGGVWIARNKRERDAVTGALGPDAAELGRDQFYELLERRRGGIKAALMDQRLLAGIGNLLADEILWSARVHPRAQVSSLTRGRRDRVFDSLHETLRRAIPARRVPPIVGWLTAVRDERDPRCPRCESRLRRTTVAGRSSCWCPRCQRPSR